MAQQFLNTHGDQVSRGIKSPFCEKLWEDTKVEETASTLWHFEPMTNSRAQHWSLVLWAQVQGGGLRVPRALHQTLAGNITCARALITFSCTSDPWCTGISNSAFPKQELTVFSLYSLSWLLMSPYIQLPDSKPGVSPLFFLPIAVFLNCYPLSICNTMVFLQAFLLASLGSLHQP